jgi:glycosyltransferase involved in cell wall biosynthesis
LRHSSTNLYQENNIRVLQIWNDYLPIFTGAAIRHNQLAQLLIEHGIKVNVLAPQTNGLCEHEVINNVEVARFPSGPFRDKKLRSIWGAFYLCCELWLRRKEYDLVHAVTTNDFWSPVFLFVRILGKPVVLEFTLLEGQQKSMAGRLLTQIANYFFKQMDAYIAISTPLVREIKARGLSSAKCFLIYYGVYPDRFAPLDDSHRKSMRECLGLNQDDYYLIFIGSFIQRKGVDILVEMMELLKKARCDIHMVIIGENDFPHLDFNHPAHRFATQMKERIVRNGLQEQIHLVSRVKYEEILQWLQVCDMFIFPSRREGLGRVILEAMSVGLPCICSELDGIAYDIFQSDVDGIVIRDGSANDYAEEVIRLIDDPNLRQKMGNMARREVIERFDERKIIEDYKKLFENLVKNNKRS